LQRPLGREITRLVEATDGNPFFLQQLALVLRQQHHSLQTLHTAQPLPGVNDLLELRFEGLPSDAWTLFELASIAGGAITLPLLREVSGMQGPRFQAALEILTSEHMLQPAINTLHQDTEAVSGDLVAYDITHDRFREWGYARLDADHRTQLHQHFAYTLEQKSNIRADIVLRHWDAIGDAKKIRHHLQRAAQEAWQQLAFNRAKELFERVLTFDDLRPVEMAQAFHALLDINYRLGHYAEALNVGLRALHPLHTTLPA